MNFLQISRYKEQYMRDRNDIFVDINLKVKRLVDNDEAENIFNELAKK